ncbi:unnamed protein product [Microthlaspi erraticum]|uniref:RRM domain-containing protein n=1 Tax=Microthlaspi erraticum TaxID=1685480 RepID=A0A6D2KDA6_9BRAS|nr:unnamed protein product [Microthlaspi erraticum]
MEGSATQGLQLNDCDADSRKSSIVSRIYVTGYDTSLSGNDFVISMTERFGSCGELIHIYIPGYDRGRKLNRFALIYLRGEGAEEKALKLSGSDSSRGHKLVVESYPFDAKDHEPELATMRDEDNKQHIVIFVDGYDTKRPLEYVKRMLLQELSKFGRVLHITLLEDAGGLSLSRYAYVDIDGGIGTIERMLQQRGCYVEGLEDMKLSSVDRPERDDDDGFCNMPPLSSLACSSPMLLQEVQPSSACLHPGEERA